MRLRKTWGFNDVPPPYSERRVESYDQHTNRSFINEDGELERSRSIERVNRVTDRRVTPGRESDVINEQVRERSSENTTIAPNPSIFDPGGQEFDSRNFYRSGTREDFHEFDPFASEETVQVQFRLNVPHPKRRKAQIERARREIDLARFEALAEEREVVLEVREMYEELQFLQTQIALMGVEDDAAESFEETQRRLLDEGMITLDDVEYVRRNPFGAEIAQAEFENLRGELAAKVGLLDESRIRVTDRLISPAVSLGVSDLPYLIEMAFANRAEINAILGKGRIAEADLAQAKAKLMPWFDYIQAGFGRSEQGGIQTDTAWGVQFAMNLPVFTWFGHEREVYEAAIASYYAQKEASQGIITGEVTAAYKAVQRAAKLRASARGHAAKQKTRNDEFLARFEGMEERQYAETRYDIARHTARADVDRLQAERSYNRALIRLEQAIGAPLDRIFDGSGKPVEVTEAASPSQLKSPEAAPGPSPAPQLENEEPSTGEGDPEKREPKGLLDRLRFSDKEQKKPRAFGKRRR